MPPTIGNRVTGHLAVIDLAELSILVVEDDRDHALLTRTRLKRIGCRAPTVVTTFGEAERHIATEPAPDVILLDLGLPDASGPDLVRRVREVEPRATLIVVSSHRDAAIASEVIALGADDFLSKSPLPQEELERCLRVNLERRAKLADANRLEAKLAEAEARLNFLAAADPITGLPGRESLDAHLTHEWRRSQRLELPMSFVLLELKAEAGSKTPNEESLVAVAEILRDRTRRATELVGRHGETTFGLILGNIELDKAQETAELLIARAGKERALRASITSTGPLEHDSPEALRERAEGALSEAAWQNCVVVPPTEGAR